MVKTRYFKKKTRYTKKKKKKAKTETFVSPATIGHTHSQSVEGGISLRVTCQGKGRLWVSR